ncbi:hypothetical protein CKO28_24765 [Rhodovibrio sodomensis]|uniref:DUF2938 domain-containing protein n=1 Tax=Rhodovibrio sodomensis TaxID=1088 RepID=A0ABS1DM69_9PROT|nr:hypothetical protein [Rhodovibrio sodomensis]MBK1671218.1 hypothetical protein [Rhodovibrio sodomensis]
MPLNDVKGQVKAVLAGLITALGTALVIIPLFVFDLIMMPEPPSQAFAETLLGPVNPYVGFLFHVGYVTLVSSGFLVAVGRRPPVWAIAVFCMGLWIFAMISFFPIIGWGVAGATVRSSVALGAIGPHVVFGAILWACSRTIFREDEARAAGDIVS